MIRWNWKSRTSLAVLLTLSLQVGASSSAVAATAAASARSSAPRLDPAALYQVAHRLKRLKHAYQNREDLEVRFKQLAGSDSSSDAVVNAGRTIVNMMILLGVGAAQEISSGQDTRLNEASQQAADVAIARSEIWIQLLTRGTISTAFKAPAHLFLNLMGSAASKSALREIVAQGILSIVTLAGTEFAFELWHEARTLLESKEDYERSRRLLPLLWGKQKGDANDERILGLVLDNMKKILFVDDELQNDLFYNAWRLKIATGDFVTMVMLMTATSTATALVPAPFPGAGFLIGAIFGAAGGLAAMYLPQSYKDKITENIRELRKWTNEQQLYTNEREIQARLLFISQRSTSSGNPTEQDISNLLNPLRTELGRRGQIREHLLTVSTELHQMILSRIVAIEHEIAASQQLARFAQTEDALKIASEGWATVETLKKQKPEVEKRIKKDRERIREWKAELARIQETFVALYPSETTRLTERMNEFDNTPAQAKALMKAELKKFELLGQMNSQLVEGLRKFGTQEEGNGSLAVLKTFYYFGYDESNLMEAWFGGAAPDASASLH